jgi:hypothetical protein
MNAVKIPMGRDQKIALVAHDNMKRTHDYRNRSTDS